MNRILNNLEKTLLNKGIVIFILGLIALWIVGYILIDYFTAAEWQRYKLQLLFSRITLVTALFIVFLGSYNLLKQFLFNFSRTASDLAIFRILYFVFFAVGIFLNPNKISDLVLPFLEMPTSAQVAIPFMSWYPKIIPINLTIVSLMTVLFYTSIFTSLIGFKTRWSILIFTITLTYLFLFQIFTEKSITTTIWFGFLQFWPLVLALIVFLSTITLENGTINLLSILQKHTPYLSY